MPKVRLDEVTAKARAREQALQKEIADHRLKFPAPKRRPKSTRLRPIDEMQDKYEDLVQKVKDEARALRKKWRKCARTWPITACQYPPNAHAQQQSTT